MADTNKSICGPGISLTCNELFQYGCISAEELQSCIHDTVFDDEDEHTSLVNEPVDDLVCYPEDEYLYQNDFPTCALDFKFDYYKLFVPQNFDDFRKYVRQVLNINKQPSPRK